MDVPIYVINLDRSPDRLKVVREGAAAFGWRLIRVPGVDGKKLTPAELQNFDRSRFEWIHGRSVLPSEIGCYLSHLRALDMGQAAQDEFFIVIEDDVAPTLELRLVVDELTKLDGWDMVKLVNYRSKYFRPARSLTSDISVGTCGLGPTGGAPAYLVRRDAVSRLRDILLPMSLPYDIAFERGWAGDLELFSTNKRVVTIQSQFESVIVGGVNYRDTKFPFYRRGGALLFRTGEFFRRLAYAYRKNSLRRKAP